MFKKLLVSSILTVSLLLWTGCSLNNYPASANILKDNNLTISLALPAKSDSLSKALVVISKPGLDTIYSTLSIEKDRVYGTVKNIPSTTNLHIVINIYDIHMNVVYSGDTYADIISGKVTDVVIKLKSAKGSINVIGIFNEDTIVYPDTIYHDTIVYPDTVIYNASGWWKIFQNNHNSGAINLVQNGTALSGCSQWITHSNGPISGSIFGNTINFTVIYPEGDTSFCSAIISYRGDTLTGYTISSTGDSAKWYAVKIPSYMYGNPCVQWNIKQSNTNSGALSFAQDSSNIEGYSYWTTHSNGPIYGTVSGDSIKFTITYPEGVTGYYYGKFNSRHDKIQGTTKSSTGDSATWTAEKIYVDVFF